jgi:hypothetical protein
MVAIPDRPIFGRSPIFVALAADADPVLANDAGETPAAFAERVATPDLAGCLRG